MHNEVYKVLFKTKKGGLEMNEALFGKYIYELKKGLRNLVLYTTDKSLRRKIEKRLKKEEITYIIYPVKENNINIFFGDALCIEVIRTINKQYLYDYTPEEDFMLGMMLGYGVSQQCERFLNYKR